MLRVLGGADGLVAATRTQVEGAFNWRRTVKRASKREDSVTPITKSAGRSVGSILSRSLANSKPPATSAVGKTRTAPCTRDRPSVTTQVDRLLQRQRRESTCCLLLRDGCTHQEQANQRAERALAQLPMHEWDLLGQHRQRVVRPEDFAHGREGISRGCEGAAQRGNRSRLAARRRRAVPRIGRHH